MSAQDPFYTEKDLANVAPSLQRAPFEFRALFNSSLTCIAWMAALIASVPLFSVLYGLIVKGGHRLSLEVFTELPPAGFEEGGGFGNAIVGTLVTVGFGALISIPIGILAAIFLAELEPNSKSSLCGKVLRQDLDGLAVYPGRCVRLCRGGAGDRYLFGARGGFSIGPADAAHGGADG